MPELVKAARQLLGWPRVRLAVRLGVSESSVCRYEEGRGIPAARGIPAIPLDLMKIRTALETAGVIFVEENGDGPWVRLRKGAK